MSFISALSFLALFFNCVFSEHLSSEKTINGDENVFSVRLPSLNDVNRGERMTISVPVPILKTPPTPFVRQVPVSIPQPIPVPQPDPIPIGPILNNNAAALFHELYKLYPSQMQQFCAPNMGYTSQDVIIPYRNNDQLNTNLQQALYQQYHQLVNHPKTLQLSIPPEIPPKTVAKLDKLINTLNKSLVNVCNNIKSDSSTGNVIKHHENCNCGHPDQQDQKFANEFHNKRYDKWVERNLIVQSHTPEEGKQKNGPIIAHENEHERIRNIADAPDCSFDVNCHPTDLEGRLN